MCIVGLQINIYIYNMCIVGLQINKHPVCITKKIYFRCRSAQTSTSMFSS